MILIFKFSFFKNQLSSFIPTYIHGVIYRFWDRKQFLQS